MCYCDDCVTGYCFLHRCCGGLLLMNDKDYTEPLLDLYSDPSDYFSDTLLLLMILYVSFICIWLINDFNVILETIHGAG